MMKQVDTEEKVMHNTHTPGGTQTMWFLTEDESYGEESHRN